MSNDMIHFSIKSFAFGLEMVIKEPLANQIAYLSIVFRNLFKLFCLFRCWV